MDFSIRSHGDDASIDKMAEAFREELHRQLRHYGGTKSIELTMRADFENCTPIEFLVKVNNVPTDKEKV